MFRRVMFGAVKSGAVCGNAEGACRSAASIAPITIIIFVICSLRHRFMEWIFQCFVNAGQTTGMNEYNGSKSSGGIEMAMEKGPLSINSENMFPIIKKWLYSDHDIFYRELISNGCDAITKLKKLDMMGERPGHDRRRGEGIYQQHRLFGR